MGMGARTRMGIGVMRVRVMRVRVMGIGAMGIGMGGVLGLGLRRHGYVFLKILK